MGEVERGIYERSVSDLERRQLCCHLQIADRIQRVAGAQQKTIEEVRVALVEQTRKVRRWGGDHGYCDIGFIHWVLQKNISHQLSGKTLS